jgi:hypothetical protein
LGKIDVLLVIRGLMQKGRECNPNINEFSVFIAKILKMDVEKFVGSDPEQKDPRYDG